MTRQYFEGDSYSTPPGNRRDLADRLFLGTRFWFYCCYIHVLAESRGFARRGEYGRENWAQASWNVLRAVERCGGRVEITGFDYLRNTPPPFVLVGNHMSTLETHVIPVMVLPIADMTFIVKESLTRHFYFGPIMRACNPICVRRASAREDFVRVLTEGKRILGEGRSLVVFPQSTRRRVFEPALFNTMGAKLAERAGVPLIPVAVKTDFWDNGRIVRDIGPIRRSRTAHLEIGRPIAPGLSVREAHAEALAFITERLLSWGGEVRGYEENKRTVPLTGTVP